MTINEQQASNDWGKADILSLLAQHLPDDLKPQALNVARNLSDPGARASALSSLSVVMTEADALIIKEEALAIAQSLDNQYLKVRALAEVTNALSDNRKREVAAETLAYVQCIPGEWHRKRALMLLANHLPDELADQAILLAHQFQDDQARLQSLSKFAHGLSAHEIISLLNDVRLIEDEASRATVLISLMKYLPRESKSDLLKSAIGFGEAEPRSQVFAALARNFPDHRVVFQEEAIKMARSLIEPFKRFWALFDVLPSLPASVKDKVLEEAFDTITMIEDKQWRAFALFYLAPILPEEQRPAVTQEALETARQVEDTYRRVIALLTMIEALPDELHSSIVHEAMMTIT